MCWKIEYIALILLSTLIDFSAGRALAKSKNLKQKKAYLLLSLLTNLGLLFTFKYFNFFLDSAHGLFAWMGYTLELPYLHLLLPVGISFYTFQSMSYTIDVYYGRIQAETKWIPFALYVAYFPQLVAGPIERASHLLPQLTTQRPFDYHRVVSGIRLMAWGFFKKVVIADRLAIFVEQAYQSPQEAQPFQLLVATYFFAIQIYCDFSGYSDIAIGASRMIGIDLMQNFKRPYFATSIREFWKRWHISLTSWFKDYVYIPLGGSHVNPKRIYANIAIVFLLSGLWHGANWTFIAWGALHASYLITEQLLARAMQKTPRWHVFWDTRLGTTLQILITFHLVLFAWILFRAPNIQTAGAIIIKCFSPIEPLHFFQSLNNPDKLDFLFSLTFISLLLLAQAIQARIPIQTWLDQRPTYFRWSTYLILLLVIGLFGIFHETQFIYFQF